MIEPLRVTFEVGCSQEHAFATWTQRIALWWPRSHTVSGEVDAQVVLEPRLGGRLYERARDGSEHDWGEVTAWEPPRLLAYVWHMRRPREDATDVEVRFVGQADGSTRVEIEHHGWERLADGSEWRQRNERAWSSLIPHYEEATR